MVSKKKFIRILLELEYGGGSLETEVFQTHHFGPLILYQKRSIPKIALLKACNEAHSIPL